MAQAATPDTWRLETQPLVVVSPHSDDAALALAHFLACRRPLTSVVTVFSLSDFDQLDDHNLERVTHTRKAEDQAFAKAFGCEMTNLDFVDAQRREGCTIDELFSLEPAHALVSQIERGLIETLPPEVTLLAPFGIGRHVDHRAVSMACSRLTPKFRLYFYLDQPYSSEQGRGSAGPSASTKPVWSAQLSLHTRKSKIAAASLYPSQPAAHRYITWLKSASLGTLVEGIYHG